MAAVFLLPIQSLLAEGIVVGAKAILTVNSRRRAAASIAVATFSTLAAALLVCNFAFGFNDKTYRACVSIALVLQAFIDMIRQLVVVPPEPGVVLAAADLLADRLAAPKA